jgi:hypothetical protein
MQIDHGIGNSSVRCIAYMGLRRQLAINTNTAEEQPGLRGALPERKRGNNERGPKLSLCLGGSKR